jgi:DNA polymerase III alpha subunit
MEDRTVVQWDKDDCSDAGLIKIDLLGLGMMTLIHRAFRLIESRHGHRLELAGFTFDDPKVYDCACEADTLGVFQIESRAQINTLPRTRPRNFYDLVVEIAIIRPGPMSTKMHRRWILRRLGQEPVTYLASSLEPVLERTLGLPIFQEQCMQMAMAVAGFSAEKADTLRQAMSRKRSLEHIQLLRDDLVAGMTANGVPEHVQTDIYTQIEGYAGYGFPEAHSCAFALLVYVSTWLKVYYHAEFTCAILNSQPMGFYHAHTLIGDAQRHGVTVRPVDVRHSRYECTIEADGAVRVGYRYVEGLGEAYQERLDAEIAAGEYDSLEDFCRRTRLPANVLEHLATAGAFECFGLERRDALWRIHAYAAAQNGDELPGLAGELLETAELRPAGRMVQARMDFAATGHSTEFRGMEFYRRALAAAGVLTADELKELAQRVREGAVSKGKAARPVRVAPVEQPVSATGREEMVAIEAAERPSKGAVRAAEGPLAVEYGAVGSNGAEGSRRKQGLDSIGAPRDRARGGHPRSQTAAALHNALIGAGEDGEDLSRYGGDERRVGNLYDGRSSGVQAPGLGDAAIAGSIRARARARTGVRVEVAGLVINRQRPPSAAGFTFLTLEDETGLVNIIVNPKTFERHKRLILDEPVLLVAGELEDEDGAIHVMASRLRAPGEVQMKTPPSNDWG